MPKGPSSPALSGVAGKAAAIFTRGAYSQYVSTGKGQERRWRLFSTDPYSIFTFALKRALDKDDNVITAEEESDQGLALVVFSER